MTTPYNMGVGSNKTKKTAVTAAHDSLQLSAAPLNTAILTPALPFCQQPALPFCQQAHAVNRERETQLRRDVVEEKLGRTTGR